MANEKRLIDLDLAIERAKESDKIVKSSIWETGEVVEFLEDCPIEDAVEVVHGWWVNNKNDYPECDKCGYMPQYDPMIDDIWYSPYCPNCGAKMDGDWND